MKFIFLRIVLFVLVCVFYGIYAGVSAIGRGVARMGRHQHHPTDPNVLPVQPLPAHTATPQEPAWDYVTELQALFALHPSGALAVDEFERLNPVRPAPFNTPVSAQLAAVQGCFFKKSP